MLRFCGNIIEKSPAVYARYRQFMGSGEGGEPFFNVRGERREAFAPYKALPFAQVGNAQFAALPDPGRYLIRYANCRALAEKHFSELTFPESDFVDASPGAYDRLNECLHQIGKFRALYADMLVLHASAVVYLDEALLFSGASGAGKSTQARLWQEHADAWVLNYDKPVAKLTDGGVMISGSPWGGKEDLSVNAARPARALFFVHQAKENRLVRLSAALAYSRMYLNYFVYPLTQDVENRYSDALVRFIRRVPVYDLYCTDTQEAVQCVQRELMRSDG